MEALPDYLVSAFVTDFFRVVGNRVRTNEAHGTQTVQLPSLDAMEKTTSGAMYTIRLFGIAAPFMAGMLESQKEVLSRASSHLLLCFARHKNHLHKINQACKVHHSDVDRVYEGQRLVGAAVAGAITGFTDIGALSTSCVQSVRVGVVRVFSAASKRFGVTAATMQYVHNLVEGLDAAPTVSFSNSTKRGPTTSVIAEALQDTAFSTVVGHLRAREVNETLWSKFPELREVVVQLFLAIHIRLGFTTRPHEFKTLADTTCREAHQPWGLKYDYAMHGLLLTFYPHKYNTPGSDGTGVDREVCAETGLLLLAIDTLFGAPTPSELADIDFDAELGARLQQARLGSCRHARQVGVYLFEAIQGDAKSSAEEKAQAATIALSFAHGERTHVGVHYANEADRNDTRVMLRMRSNVLGLNGVELPIRRIQGVFAYGKLRDKEAPWRQVAANDDHALLEIRRWAKDQKIPTETCKEAFNCLRDCSLAQVCHAHLLVCHSHARAFY